MKIQSSYLLRVADTNNVSHNLQERKLWEKRIKQYEVDIMREIFGDLHPVLPHSKAREIIESFKGNMQLFCSIFPASRDRLAFTLFRF